MKTNDGLSQYLIELYDLENWVKVSTTIPISLETWIGQDPWRAKYGLNPQLRSAIVYCTNKINQERRQEMENKQKEQELKYATQTAAALKMPHDRPSSINKYLN